MIGSYNPFNIRYNHANHWIGQCMNPQTKGFVNFKALEYGVRAVCIIILRSYRAKGIFTIQDVISRFAPKSENDTMRYIGFVCSCIGSFPFDIPQNVDEYCNFLSAMSQFEGNKVEPSFIKHVIDKYHIKPLCLRKKD